MRLMKAFSGRNVPRRTSYPSEIRALSAPYGRCTSVLGHHKQIVRQLLRNCHRFRLS